MFADDLLLLNVVFLFLPIAEEDHKYPQPGGNPQGSSPMQGGGMGKAFLSNRKAPHPPL